MLVLELPGNSEAWSAVLGPLPLASLSSLLALLGAVLQWRRERSLEWVILLMPLVISTPLLVAYRERTGYLVMGLLLQPFALWVWSPVLSKAIGLSPPPVRLARWGFAASFLPVVWIASCTYGFVGEANERVARLESLPVPAGAVVVEKNTGPYLIEIGDQNDSILYRVPMPREEAEAEVYRRFEEEGWVRHRNDYFFRDGECVSVHIQIWTWSPEWSSSENTHLRISLLDPDEC